MRDTLLQSPLLALVDAVPFAGWQDFAHARADVRVAVGFGVEGEGAGGAVGWDAVAAGEVLSKREQLDIWCDRWGVEGRQRVRNRKLG